MKNRLVDLRLWASVVSLCLVLTQAAAAQALSGSQFLSGSYELHGKRDDGVLLAVRLQVSTRPNGKFALERHVLLRDRPGSRERWQVAVEQVGEGGERLRVVYTLPAFARRSGVVHALRGETRLVERSQNTIVGVYRFSKATGEVREVLSNQTRLAPEASWKSSLAVGGKHTRLRLGEERRLPAGGVLNLILPCSGVLHLEGAKLTRSDGSVVLAGRRQPGQGPNELRYPVEAGTYRVQGQTGALVRSFLVQAAQLAGREAPWTTESWYPIHEFESNGDLNDDTLYRAEGPLERFDRAFGLKGRQSAVAWERGDSDRLSDGFRSGHYHRRGVIRESRAELDSGVDLDGDGQIGGEPRALARQLDHDQNGRISEAELQRAVSSRLREALIRYYDFDKDGVVRVGTDVARSDAQVYDLNRDGLLSPSEFAWILRGKGPLGRQAQGMQSRWRDALTAQVRRGAELSAQDLPAGAHDFVDNDDQDRDGREDYEERNYVFRLRSGKVAVANGYRRVGADFRLDDSRQIPARDVITIRRRADGDYADVYRSEWWGHCNGVAIAGILFEEPEAPIAFRGQTFDPEDLKGLLSEFALGEAGIHGFQWTKDRYRARSLPDYTREFHATLRALQPGRTSFMADVELKSRGQPGEVWNYALIGYRLVLRESSGDDPRVLEVVAKIEHTGGSLGLRYRLHFAKSGEILATAASKTTWQTQDEAGAPRLLRYLLAVKPISGPNRRANPFVSEGRLRQLFGGRLPYRQAKPPEVADSR